MDTTIERENILFKFRNTFRLYRSNSYPIVLLLYFLDVDEAMADKMLPCSFFFSSLFSSSIA